MYNSNRFHEFTIQEISSCKTRKILKNKSGLYFAKDFNDDIVYIGLARNLYTRLDIKRHHKISTHTHMIKCVYIIEINNIPKLREVQTPLGETILLKTEPLVVYERKLISKFQPKLNTSNTPKHRDILLSISSRKAKSFEIFKDDKLIIKCNTVRELMENFSPSNPKGLYNYQNNILRKLPTTAVKKMRNGEIINGISIKETTVI